MALTNQQYEFIMKGYDQTQTQNRHLLEQRRAEVYQKLPKYHILEESVGRISVEYARKMFDGGENTLQKLHQALAKLSSEKQHMLISGGFPADYLEPIYHCPACHDTGYLVSEDNTSLDPHSRKCHCFRQQEINLLYEQSNIHEFMKKENFSTLSYEYYQGEDLEHFKEAVKLCKMFVQSFEQDFHNLFFYGTVGTGKSFLSGCIAAELLKASHSVIYFSSSSLFDNLARYTFDVKSKETLYNFYKDLYNCELVIIDDLGTEVTNSFVTSQLFACLNERFLRRKATIISTNLNLEELRDRYSDRIFSRITSHFTLCKLTGPDIRMYRKRLARLRPSDTD